MKVNEKVLECLKDFRIPAPDGICYLVSLYLGFSPSYIPETLKQKVNATGIVVIDRHGTVQWNIPLYDEQITAFEWVQEEYLQLFTPFGKQNKYKRECVSRMKRLFANNPELRKSDVLAATEIYINLCRKEQRQAKFVKNPHYFIEQGKGLNKTSMLLSYIEEHKAINKEETTGRESLSVKMQ